jgi:ABC-2 type transport system ATP-binding protein
MSDARPPAIAAAGLRKSFGATAVLDGVDFSVAPGTVFALLGPNGSGKTTTVNILATLLSPDGGEVLVAGYDVAREADAVRDVIGVTGQFAAVDALLTGRENLALMADLHHFVRADAKPRIDALLGRFDLLDAADRTAATYSGGMRRRLDLAMTLIGAPEIIFLDEPTAGLDPRSRRTMWEIVRGLVSDGATVFLTTQYLEEADQLADRVAILDGGGWSPRARPRSSRRGSPAATSASRSPTAAPTARPRASWTRPRVTRTHSPCRSRRTATSRHCGTCCASSTKPTSRSRACRSTSPISTTCSWRSRADRPRASRRRYRDERRLRPARLGHDAAAQPAPPAPLPGSVAVSDPDAEGHMVTGSTLWPNATATADALGIRPQFDQVVFRSKQVVSTLVEAVSNYGYANFSRYCGTTPPGISRNAHGLLGSASVLLEMRGDIG